jgi:hypothetical protein
VNVTSLALSNKFVRHTKKSNAMCTEVPQDPLVHEPKRSGGD